MFMTVAFSIFLIQADFPICPAASFSGYPASIYYNNQYYVFWVDQRTLPNMSIYGARVTLDGTVLDPAGIQVYNDSASYCCNVAFDGTNFLVVTRNHCWTKGDNIGVRVTPDMVVLDTFTICNPAADSIIQSYADLVFNGENYVVVWSDEKFGTYYVTASRVTPGGAVLDTGICISTGAGGYEYNPKIAYDGNRCLAVWPKSSLIQGRFINSAGLPEDAVFNIAASGSGPVVACDGTNYLVAWFIGTYPSLDIKAQLISATGTPIGSEITVTTDSDCNRWPDIIYDGYQYMVVWTKGANTPSSQYVWAQGISTAGSLINGNFMISANTPGQRWFPVVASSNSNYLVAWGQSGATSDIYGNTDHGILTIQEETIRRPSIHEPVRATLICSSLKAFIDAGDEVFDISGRKVMTDAAEPGVYFIARSSGEKSIGKIIKIK